MSLQVYMNIEDYCARFSGFQELNFQFSLISWNALFGSEL